MRILLILIPAVVAAMMSCGGRKKDAAYYEQMVDSIRKAEQVKQMKQAAGIHDDHAVSFFDTLRLHSLPIRCVDNMPEPIGLFTPLPSYLNSSFGYGAAAQLRVVALPRSQHADVLLLAEVTDSLRPSLYLCTMRRSHRLIDILCIYEQKRDDRLDDEGYIYTDYFVTSQYAITLMQYYKSHHSPAPKLFQSRRYTINEEGRFEEQIIEL
jgi:hypothetical protein